ncbi:RNA polymerase subunit sigma [Pseudoalteromonas phenolica]|uniref:RNA polymerase sigma factor n=1 Tax=Pseudoalteromonas phenolica TaxID=161398 RepID=A0A4Q7IN61_9GAMM|nr:sigma-70 family RNA polymerase sigma factor [Pseudoalteromonas phenolica]RZQ53192.1 RNA polymerase subunit sigma [Pseudoalteromonas phenolica]TMP79757.1 RNA polymerase subunit sigma [Pseudoalteromonas phenolica]
MTKKQQRYEELVKQYQTELYRFAYWLSKDPTVAEDLVQETFLRAWRALDSLQDEKAVKPWLLTIVRRENARRFERKQFDYADVDNDTIVDNQSTTLDSEMEQTVIQRQISLLSIEYREPLLLQVVMGCSGDEIAEILELNKNTVMTRLYRARNQLKEALMSQPQTMTGATN